MNVKYVTSQSIPDFYIAPRVNLSLPVFLQNLAIFQGLAPLWPPMRTGHIHLMILGYIILKNVRPYIFIIKELILMLPVNCHHAQTLERLEHFECKHFQFFPVQCIRLGRVWRYSSSCQLSSTLHSGKLNTKNNFHIKISFNSISYKHTTI